MFSPRCIRIFGHLQVAPNACAPGFCDVDESPVRVGHEKAVRLVFHLRVKVEVGAVHVVAKYAKVLGRHLQKTALRFCPNS